MKKRTLEVIVLIALYLFMMWLWTTPIRSNPMPYGQPDASIHYRIFHDIYTKDKVSIREPYSSQALGFADPPRINGQPPAYHVGIAISEIFGGHIVISPYIHIFLICSLVFFTLYFFIRKLYGVPAALLASTFLIFSFRDIMTYTWGQWATGEAIMFIPVIMYSFYKYTDTFLEKKTRNTYLFLFSILLAFQFIIHTAIFFLTISMLMSYTVLLLMKYRKIPFSIKKMFLAVLLFLVILGLFAPFQLSYLTKRISAATGLVDYSVEEISAGVRLKDEYDTGIKRIFGWYNFPYDISGNYPERQFEFNFVYRTSWLFVFLFLGLLIFLIKRRNKDLLMFSMFLGMYLILHTDVIGWHPDPKILRLFYAEGIIFYSLIAIGITQWTKSKLFQWSCAAVGVILIILLNISPIYAYFSAIYPPHLRLNEQQMDMAEWIEANTPDNATVYYLGFPTFNHRAWFQAVSSRYGEFEQFNVMTNSTRRTDYLVMDFSYYLNDDNVMKMFQAIHDNINGTFVYGNGYLNLYKVS